ncbi:MAG: flagellar hook-associated protein FlgL [Azonexus sp.]
MRISTSMIFSNATQNMLQLQSGIYHLQNQMSTGRRILTPSDDPVAAAQALTISQNQAVNKQYLDNQGNAADKLALIEGHINSVSELIVSVQEQAASAVGKTGSDPLLKVIAAEIRQRYDELVGLSNSSDALGDYVFSGFSSKIQPFSAQGSPGSRTVSYAGDGGQQQLQVASGRLMDVSESGSAVFMRIPQGNGHFVFSAGSANAGTGTISASSLVSGYDQNTYELNFTSASTYTLTTNGVNDPTPVAYTPGSAIVLGASGQQINIAISGTPAPGDTFSVVPATNQDIFKTLDDMITALESNVSTNDSTKAAFKNQMDLVSKNLGQALVSVLTVQTSVGARRAELESLTSAANDADTQYQSNLDRLQNLDYTQAISDMSNQKMILDAAMQSFTQVSQMSLFNYL